MRGTRRAFWAAGASIGFLKSACVYYHNFEICR